MFDWGSVLVVFGILVLAYVGWRINDAVKEGDPPVGDDRPIDYLAELRAQHRAEIQSGAHAVIQHEHTEADHERHQTPTADGQ